MQVSHEYDYKNQAWLVDGRYVACGHTIENCKCFGTVHEGQTKEEARCPKNARARGEAEWQA